MLLWNCVVGEVSDWIIVGGHEDWDTGDVNRVLRGEGKGESIDT
jgi:hypothetical protein